MRATETHLDTLRERLSLQWLYIVLLFLLVGCASTDHSQTSDSTEPVLSTEQAENLASAWQSATEELVQSVEVLTEYTEVNLGEISLQVHSQSPVNESELVAVFDHVETYLKNNNHISETLSGKITLIYLNQDPSCVFESLEGPFGLKISLDENECVLNSGRSGVTISENKISPH